MLKLKKIKQASLELKHCPVKIKNKFLSDLSLILIRNSNLIIKANIKDLKKLDSSYSLAFRDRLKIDLVRIQQMTNSLKIVAQQPDPLKINSHQKRILKNGLILNKIRSSLGVVFMIFESRPNVAIEAFSIGFKSGNAMILRGGKESHYTTNIFYKLIQQALIKNKLSKNCVWGITNSDRKLVDFLLSQKNDIDLVVPRGGENLISYVSQNTQIPIIKNDRGLCHIYIHSDADLDMAVKILVNAKTQRPSVCNSMETMLIHKSVSKKILPLIYNEMNKHHVVWYGCRKTKKIFNSFKNVHLASQKNWNTEYLDQIVNCKIVDSDLEALKHIQKYTSHHSESIVTRNKKIAMKFQTQIDAAVVYWNASTRFTDGFAFGLGGELGISTQKIHVRGPVGLEALTCERWIVDGSGQIR